MAKTKAKAKKKPGRPAKPKPTRRAVKSPKKRNNSRVDKAAPRAPSAQAFSVANMILQGASYREVGKAHEMTAQNAHRLTRQVEEWEKTQQIDDRLKMKQDSTKRLRRSLYMVSTILETQFAMMEEASEIANQARESGKLTPDHLILVASCGIDMKAVREHRETDRELRELWGVGPATVGEESQTVPDSQLTNEEFEEQIEAARAMRERRIRMRKEMEKLTSKLKKPAG